MNFLAIETSTERLSLAVQNDGHILAFEGAGGAQSSATLIPAVMGLLQQANLSLPDLNAIAFGRGPGAFTGLRTACAVAQGLALGADLPVLPIDTLLCVAEAARTSSERVLVLMDARMQQVYAAAYEWQDAQWHCVQAPQLLYPAAVALPDGWTPSTCVIAGNALTSPDLQDGLQHLHTSQALKAALWPQATPMLRLAHAAWLRGDAVDADQALPVYVRDQVALTTAERLALKAAAA
jgi:tRNA threonylcarbamoyladenosine biosynthesis protein TsaB